MNKNQLLVTWKDFLSAVEKRFGPSEYEDSFGKLSKLTQQNSLGQYQHQFEHLANKSLGVPEHVLISCFVSRLQSELRKEIQVYRPQALVQATGLARLFDDNQAKGRDEGYRGSKFHGPDRSSSLPPLLPTPPPEHLPRPLKITAPFPNNSHPTVIIKRLSPSEMAARREKGLCYNCDEKFSPAHKCKGRMFFFMVDDDREGNTEQNEVYFEPELQDSLPEIAFMQWKGR